LTTLWRPCMRLALVCTLLASAGVASAQTATVSADRENLRIAPGGNILAEVLAGTALDLGASQGDWREVTLDGWVWALSVQEERRGELDLIVLPPEGESLRGRPQGETIARLRPGMRLISVETSGDWIRVRRTGWMWAPSLAAVDRAAANGEGRIITAGPGGLAVLAGPAGDTVARVFRGVAAEVVAREGDWARVRIEGWTYVGDPDAAAGAAAVLRDVTRAQLRQNPARYRGRLIEWPVQFIALQQAERFRSDFRGGEPFLLARGPGDDAGFIYIAIPADRIEEVRDLAPLERIHVLARVRIGRSTLTDAPVLELLQITRADIGSP